MVDAGGTALVAELPEQLPENHALWARQHNNYKLFMAAVRAHECERQGRNSEDYLNQLHGCQEMGANKQLPPFSVTRKFINMK